MLRIIILSALLATIQADVKERIRNVNSQMEAIQHQCATEFELTPEEVKNLEDNLEGVESRKNRCYLECFLTKFGSMKDGSFYRGGADNVSEYLYAEDPESLERAKEMSRVCEKRVHLAKIEDGCDAAVEIMKCFKKETKRIYFKEDGDYF